VPHLHEAHARRALSYGFHHSVDAVARHAEDPIDAPGNQRVDQELGAVARFVVVVVHGLPSLRDVIGKVRSRERAASAGDRVGAVDAWRRPAETTPLDIR